MNVHSKRKKINIHTKVEIIKCNLKGFKYSTIWSQAIPQINVERLWIFWLYEIVISFSISKILYEIVSSFSISKMTYDDLSFANNKNDFRHAVLYVIDYLMILMQHACANIDIQKDFVKQS